MQTAKLSKVALSLLALAATACAPTGVTAPVATPTPGPSASAGGTANPTPSPSATTGQTGSTAAPTPNQGGAVNPKLVVLSGTVYDEAGATVDNATVNVKSLDTGNPYTAKVTTAEGSYVVNNVPEGVNVEISVTKDGYTTRRQVGVFQAAASQKNEVNFGSTLTVTTDKGSAYFISKYPEVASTEPAYNASNVDNASLTYKLKLSEALDDTNRRRFEEAIRVMPANTLANPGGGVPVDFTDLNDQTTDYDITTITGGGTSGNATAPYWIKKGSLFLNESATRANVTWSADNTEATLTFNAPLATNRTDVAKYQVGLAAPAGGDRIVDKDNNQLGTDKANSLSAYPPAGDLIRNAFVPNSLSISGNPANGAARWAATHKSVSIFSVKQDNIDPNLVSVTYTKNLGADSRFELTFDKPIVAFNASGNGRMDSNITNGNVLDTITFAISDRVGGTKTASLKGQAGVNVINTVTATNVGSSSSDIEKEFKLDKTNFKAGLHGTFTVGADNGKLALEVDPRNPKTLFIYVFNKTSLFDTKITEIKARAEGVADPAGNAIKSAGADANQPTGSI
jgi:hypothetical protein